MGKQFYRLVAVAILLISLVTISTQQQQENNPSASQSDWPVGHPRRCQDQSRLSKVDIERFEILPGGGWDNLRNLEAGLVVTYNFTQCKLTDDGNFLIPDNVFTIPIKSSQVQMFSEVIDQWHTSSSLTSITVNVAAGVSIEACSISGTFSAEHSQLKSKQIEDKAVTIRTQLRYERYEAKLQPDPVLSPQFKIRLLGIAARIELNQTEQASYEAQLLIRDFGTHVLTSVTAGAALVKDDYLKSDFVSNNKESKSAILVSASVSFLDLFHLNRSIGFSYNKKVSDSYNTNLANVVVKSVGGPIFKPENMTLETWAQGVDRNLVSMDRTGEPLYFLVTSQTLPELPPTTVSEVEKYVRQAIELYYEMNTIRGCTKLGSPNFSFSANFDDGSCNAKPTNLAFGGVYQTCTVSGTYLYTNPCSGLDQVNPKTGSYSCPESYSPVLIQSTVKAGITEYKKTCRTCRVFFKCCQTEKQFDSFANISTYWCAATGPVSQDTGYLFGGLYKSSQANPVTGKTKCPPTFYSRKILFDVYVCISDEFEQSSPVSVPFGGFFSCKLGNPLAAEVATSVVGSQAKALRAGSLQAFMAKETTASYPMKCPEGYSQYLATVEEGCSIYYCVRTGSLSGPNLPPIKRPPFMSKPATNLDTENNVVMFDEDSQTWMRNEKALAFQNEPAQKDNINGGTSKGATAGLSVSVTLACVALAFGVIMNYEIKG